MPAAGPRFLQPSPSVETRSVNGAGMGIAFKGMLVPTITQTVSQESENGDWLRRALVFASVLGLPTVPVPFFGRSMASTVEKGDRHLAATFFPAIPADICSEPVPIFHYPLTV